MIKNRTILTFTVLILSIASCRKDRQVAPAPVAGFTFDGDTSRLLTMPAYGIISLISNSKNADSFLWDYGDGRTSTNKEIGLSYSKTGVYLVTLTAISRGGRKSEFSKTVKVVEPILKKVIIKSLNWDSIAGPGGSYIKTDKANIWVEIQQGAPDNLNYPVLSNGLFEMPVIYKSPVARDIDSTKVPIEFEVPNKIVIDYPALSGCCEYKGRGYSINLFAQDTTGTYLLCSTSWSGGGFTYFWNIPNDQFTILGGLEG